MVEVVENFIKNMAVFLKGVYDFDGKIFLQTREFLGKVEMIVTTLSKDPMMDLFALASLGNDVAKLQEMSGYFLGYIQKRTENKFQFELNIPAIFEITKNQIDSKIHSDYPISLGYHLKNWLTIKWMEKKPSPGPHKFVVELGIFLKSTLGKIAQINYAAGVSLAYLSYREINKSLAEVMAQHVKTFNIVDVVNLDHDLKHLCSIADEEFFHLDKLKEALSQMTQLISLFLDFNPLAYEKPDMRQSKFYSLGPQFLLKVLPKYRKIVLGSLPVVRKRECKQVTDFISSQMMTDH